MANNELISMVTELKELQSFRSEIDEQIESIEGQIKSHLSTMGTHEMRAGVYQIRWIDVTSKRFDSKAFKNDYPDIYNSYLCPSTSKRFTVI